MISGTDGSGDDVRGGGYFVIVWGGNFDQIQGDRIFVEWRVICVIDRNLSD